MLPPLSKMRVYHMMKRDPAAELTRLFFQFREEFFQSDSLKELILQVFKSDPTLISIHLGEILEHINRLDLKKGDPGDTPQKFTDYFTPEEQEEFMERLAELIPDPIKGDSVDEKVLVANIVKKTKIDEDKLIEKLLKRIGKPKRGKDADENKIIQALIGQMLPVLEKLLSERPQSLEITETTSDDPVTVAEIAGLRDELDAIKQAITRISQTKRQHGGGGDVLADGLNTTIRRLPGGKRAVDTNGGGSSGGANVLAEVLSGTQASSNVTLDLSQLSQPFTIILGVYRNGQLLVPGNTTFGWTRSGNIATVYNADAGETFQVWYTYTQGTVSGTVYSETPGGVVNDSNVAFTTTHTITTVLSFAIGINVIPKNAYSFVGTNITFTSPLGMSLATEPFTIVYV